MAEVAKLEGEIRALRWGNLILLYEIPQLMPLNIIQGTPYNMAESAKETTGKSYSPGMKYHTIL